MNILAAIRIAFRRGGSLLLAGLFLLPEMLPLGPAVSAGVTAGAMLIISAGNAEARGGTVRRPVRRTTRRVVRRTGRRVAVLGAGASLVYVESMPYYYWDGSYYERDAGGYVEVIFED